MSNQWAERVASHQINERIAALSERLQRANEPDINEEAVPYLRRAQSVINELRARVENSAPELIPVSILDRTVNHLQSAEVELDSYFQNADRAHLDTADVNIDHVAVELRALPPLPPSKQSAAVVKAARDHAEQIGSLEQAVRDNLSGLASDIEGLATEMASTRQKLESLAKDEEGLREQAKSKLDAKVSEARGEIDTKVSEARAEIDAQKARLDQAITQQQEVFLAARQTQLGEFNEAQQNRAAGFKTETDALISHEKGRFVELENEAGALIQYLKAMQTRGEQIVGVTAATQVAGAYIKEANDQKGNADLWRLVAAGVFILLLAVAPLAILVDPIDTDASLAEAITYTSSRVPILLGLALTAYAARQSAHHRRREESARRLANELTTFRPFLAELREDEMQTEIREASKRYFPGAEPPGAPQK